MRKSVWHLPEFLFLHVLLHLRVSGFLQNSCNSVTLEGFKYKVMPHYHSQIQVRNLTSPLQSLYLVFFLKPFRGGIVLWNTVLLQNLSALQLEVTNRWQFSFRMFWNRAEFMVPLTTTRLPGPEAPKQPQAITHQHYILLLRWCSLPDMPSYFYARCRGTDRQTSKKFNLCLVSPQSIFPDVLGIIKMFSGKTEMGLCVLFAQQWFWQW